MAGRQKTTRFSIQAYDNRHYQQTEAYTRAVESLFDAATKAISDAAAKGNYDPGKVFSFDDYPAVKKTMQDVTNNLAGRLQTTIETGSEKQWLFACDKNDAFLASIMDTSKLSKASLDRMQDRNLDALSAFQSRKVAGLNLSQRVWKYVGQYREQIEDALDVGLGEGRSAQQLARDVKRNLNEPDRLFRRVRDKRGNLVLSRNARAYNPGRGVYRSSVRNAQRLARSEINMAYRESDYQRWQTLDFVVGFEILRSNHKPLCDCKVCSRFVGQYPKSFKFKGWHPQCMCYAIPILADEETFDENELGDLKAALHGTSYTHKAARNTVIDVPAGFKEWVKENAARQKKWGSTPYFVLDNFVDGKLSAGLNFKSVTVAEQVEEKTVKKAGKKVDKPISELSEKEREKWMNKWRRLIDKFRKKMEHAASVYGIDCTAFSQMCDDTLTGGGMEYLRYDEANAELERIGSAIKAAADERANSIKARVAKYTPYNNGEAAKWLKSDDVKTFQAKLKKAMSAADRDYKKEYPTYEDALVLLDAVDGLKVIENVAAAQKWYNNIKGAAESFVKAVQADKSNTTDVSMLERALKMNPSEFSSGIWIADTLERLLSKADPTMSRTISNLQCRGVETLAVDAYKEVPDEATLIAQIGGGDLTKGSCSSLAFTWAANKAGMNVRDFRDGDSRDYFSRDANIKAVQKAAGGEYISRASSTKIFGKLEIGKQYYLAYGRHAAIVRKVGDNDYEYLELQSSSSNGWKKLDTWTLSWRFDATTADDAELIDIELLKKNATFKEMMSYINTRESEQVKGEKGTIK